MRAVSAASRRADGPQHPCSTPSRCTSDRCEPRTSYPCSCRRHAATDESTPPDIATRTDGILTGYRGGAPEPAGNLSYRDRRDRGALRRPERRRAELPVGGAGRRAGSTPTGRGAHRDRRRRGGRGTRALGGRDGDLRGSARVSTRRCGSGRRPTGIRSRISHSRGSPCSRLARKRPSRLRPTTRLPRRRAPGPPRSIARRYDAAIARIHEHIAAGDTYQVNFTLRLRATRRGRSEGPLPRPLLRPTWCLLGVPRPRPVPHPVRLPGAVLQDRRRHGLDQADEGHGAAGPVARGG